MKRILITLLLGLAAGTAVRLTAQPVATFDVLRHDFGSLLWKVGGRTTFKVTNTGDENLTIQDVHPDCGCTVAAWTRDPLRPGATGEIYVEYDAELLGRFRKLLAVKTNASDQPVWLTVSGDVVMEKKEYSGDYPYRIGDIYLSSDNIEFDDVNRGDMPVKVLRVFNNSKKSYSPELMHLPRYLSAKADPETVRPGRVGNIYVSLNSELLRTMGLTQTHIYLSRFPGDRVNKENEIYVSATILPQNEWTAEQLAAAPTATLDSLSLDLGDMAGKKKVRGYITISNTGKSPLVISALQVYNPGLSVSLNKRRIKPGQSDKLKITVNANSHYFKGRRRVLLITNDPQNQKIVIDVTVKK